MNTYSFIKSNKGVSKKSLVGGVKRNPRGCWKSGHNNQRSADISIMIGVVDKLFQSSFQNGMVFKKYGAAMIEEISRILLMSSEYLCCTILPNLILMNFINFFTLF